MNTALYDADAFRDFEEAGWNKQAATYDNFIGRVTQQVIEPLLDAARVGPGVRMLDVGTGPGYVAAGAAARGAIVVGVDFAEQMVALAARHHPGIIFRQADAEQLPFTDGVFDAVVANFIMLHLARPEAVAMELARVLAPGGYLALTTWDSVEHSRLSGVFFEAVQAVGAPPPADMPPGPPMFRFAADAAFAELLSSAGLAEVQVRTLSFPQHVSTADELWQGMLTGTVRAAPLILAQPDDVRQRIRAEFDRRLRAYATDAGFALPVSVKLAVGRKSAAHLQ
jgi:SAM-dependent methyltransferase